MDKLPPIPTPLRTQWREFRFKFMPVITFCALVATVVVMWRNYVVPPTVVAEAETVKSNVISTSPGTLLSLAVERFQHVTNGQVIGMVQVVETNVLSTTIAAMEADLQVTKARMRLDQLRNDANFQRQRLDYLTESNTWEVDKVLLTNALNNYIRASNLFFRGYQSTNVASGKLPSSLLSSPVLPTNLAVALIPQAALDQALSDYESKRRAVELTGIFLKEKARVLPELLIDASNVVNSTENDVKAQEAKMQAAAQNQVLRAPIDGTVSTINNRPGEKIMAGAPIVVITPLKTDRVVAVVRQPINVTPKPNDWVEVRRQSFKREAGLGKVIEVGTQLDVIDPSFMPNVNKKTIETGLPFLVKMRDNLNLKPGERVDLILNPRRNPDM